MTWFAHPLGLLALASVPAVVFLHLFRRRHHEVPVSTLFLWVDAETEESAGRVRHPLRRTPSFWLEVAAALLASLVIAGFDPWRVGSAEHHVIVLDDSASMSAGEADGESPRRRAIEHIEDALDDGGARTRVTLIASGARPRLLCGPAALIPEARQALRDWQPASPSHDLAPALALGRELSGERTLWLLSDRLPDPSTLDTATRVDAMGTPRDNLGLASPQRSPVDDDNDRVSCQVRSFADAPRQADLLLTTAGRELTRRSFTLPANGTVTFDVQLPADTPTIELSLSPDALSLDNRCMLHPPPRRRVNVGWSLGDGLPELLGLSTLTRVFPDVTIVSSDADLVIAHEPAAGPAWSLVLPRDVDAAEAFIGPFLIQHRHPLLQGVTLDGVLWTRATGNPPDGLPLVSAGDRPLLGEVVRDDTTIYAFDLLPARSTLHRSPDWPILLANLLELRRAALPGPETVNLVAGQRFACTADTAAPWTLVGPTGERDLPATDRVLLDDLPVFGEYRLRRADAADVVFAVNLVDPGESDLRDAALGHAEPAEPSVSLSTLTHAGSVTTTLLLVALAGLLAADWWVLGRNPRL